MTITIDPKEVEHILVFATTVALLLAICFISYIITQNNK